DGWTQTQVPHLAQVNDDDSVAMVSGCQTARFFDRYDGAYHPRYYDTSTLTHDAVNHLFVATDGAGSTFTFYDFSGYTPSGRDGRLLSMADAAGTLTEVTDWDAGGGPAEGERGTGAG